MKNADRLLAAACVALSAAVIAGPLDSFKGKMKPGLYEYKTETDMSGNPGIPPGMGKENKTYQYCLTAKELDRGLGRDPSDKGPPCDIKNVSQSGNSAAYTMVCGKDMTSDVKITVTDAGFNMDSKSSINAGGSAMKITQRMEGKYLGSCK